MDSVCLREGNDLKNKILAYMILNIKSLLKDKIPFVWSILLPLVMYFLNRNQINVEKDLAYWWVYMVLCAYIYGVGLYALELKESGCLRTIFSIENSPFVFFMGNLMTQIVFCLISVGLFNFIIYLDKQFSMIKMIFYSILIILLCIPVAFAGYAFTLLKNVHANTINTAFSILLFGMFMLLGTDSWLNAYNPMCYMAEIVIAPSKTGFVLYSAISVVFIVIGSMGILKFSPNSNERR